MKEKAGTTRITLAAGIASLVGPACAVLPYTDYLPAFPNLPDLAVVWLLASHRGHRHWHRRFCVKQGQQGRERNLRTDEYPRPGLLGFIGVLSPGVDSGEHLPFAAAGLVSKKGPCSSSPAPLGSHSPVGQDRANNSRRRETRGYFLPDQQAASRRR